MIDILMYMTAGELRDERFTLEQALIMEKTVPEFPPVGFKLNYARLRDLEARIERISQVIAVRETVSM